MTIDLKKLEIFTLENGIYSGVNTANFKNIEFWVKEINGYQEGKLTNALGLFGAASTGKTTTAKLTAKALKYPLICVNSAGLDTQYMWETLYTQAKNIYPDTIIHGSASYTSYSNTINYEYILQHCIVLFDECHELSNKSQVQLLSVLDGSTNRIDNAIQRKFPLYLKNITWIFSTTDSGKLLYSLATRLYPVVFSEYSEEDLLHIVKLHYPEIPYDAAAVLCRTAKFVPRTAINIIKQYVNIFTQAEYSRDSALEYSMSVRQIDECGLDAIDKAILDFLKNSINNSTSTLQQYRPRSRQDISTYCRLYDMPDLETRLGYLEKLGLVAKTKSGILWQKEINYDFFNT